MRRTRGPRVGRGTGAEPRPHPRPTDDQALAAVNVTGMVNVAPWQPVSDAFVIATPGSGEVDRPLAGTVWVTAVVVNVTPVVVQVG